MRKLAITLAALRQHEPSPKLETITSSALWKDRLAAFLKATER